MNRISSWYICLILFLTVSCLDEPVVDPSTIQSDPNNSNASDINEFVDEVMHSIYLWAEDTPDIADISERAFPNPQNLLAVLRSRQDRYSGIVESLPSGVSARVAQSLDAGLGLVLTLRRGGGIFVLHAKKGSPADLAGIQRGDIIQEIDGQVANEVTGTALLSRSVGQTYLLGIQRETDRLNISVTSDFLDIDYVSDYKVINLINGEKTGYLFYDDFREESSNKLNEVFGLFQQAGVKHLILDLRYNGGGSVDVARDLASMIYGQGTSEDVFLKEVFNEEYDNFNSDVNFREGGIPRLNLEDLIVITGSGTASASEAIIHCLSPYMPVYTIGQTTEGKNVGSILYSKFGYDFFPILFRVTDRNGDGNYSGGITPGVDVQGLQEGDYINVLLGDEGIGRVRVALDFLETGTFTPTIARKALAGEEVMQLLKPDFQLPLIDDTRTIEWEKEESK